MRIACNSEAILPVETTELSAVSTSVNHAGTEENVLKVRIEGRQYTCSPILNYSVYYNLTTNSV